MSRSSFGERHGRSVDELGKHGHPTRCTSNMGRSCGRGRSSEYGAGRSEAERTHDAIHIGSDSRVVGLEADRTLAPDFSDPIGSWSKHCEDGVCNSKMAILDDILGGT